MKTNCESGDDEVIREVESKKVPLGRFLASLGTVFGEFWVGRKLIWVYASCNLTSPHYFWLIFIFLGIESLTIHETSL